MNGWYLVGWLITFSLGMSVLIGRAIRYGQRHPFAPMPGDRRRCRHCGTWESAHG